MLARLKMELETSEDLDYKKASALQGVLLENIDKEYAGFLHQQQLHPYSQYICNDGEKKLWCVNTLNPEAYTNIIKKLVDTEFSSFIIKKGNVDVIIKETSVEALTDEELLEEFNTVQGSKTINIRLLTPMSFKQRGNYVALPDVRLIYQSMMNKYSMASEKLDMIDEDTLLQMTEHSVITKFKIRSVPFPLEGIRIPGAIGEFRIKISGSEIMARYARLLLRFAEYSGIGVKTAMGMGAIKIQGDQL